MEKISVNPTNKVELPKTEQLVEHFSFSEQEKNIREVFKLNPELKNIACESLEIEDDKDIIIELGRSKDSEALGRVQNINVYYKGKPIIDSDNVQSNKLFLVTKEDGTSYVGDIYIPTDLQGQGLGPKILQKTANTLNTKIIPTYLSTGGFTSDNAKKMWEKLGNEIQPKYEAEKLYAKYLETIFPESKVQDVVWHGTKSDWYKTEGFDTAKIGSNSRNKHNTEGSIYFIKYSTATGAFGLNKMPAKINLKNPNILPLNEFNQTWFDKDNYQKLKKGDGIIAEQEEDPEDIYHRKMAKYEKDKKELEEKKARGEKTDIWDEEFVAIGKPKSPEDFHEEQSSITYVVFDPLQIHILGSKTDIEKFKEFVSKNENKKDK